MKALIYAASLASALAAPTVSFAQDSTVPVTRAEVHADLARLEQAGYRPGVNDVHYPAGIQAAEARVQAQDGTMPNNTAVGGVSDGSSQAGAPTTKSGTHSIYFGH
ncbi:MAG: hypothetical protein JWR14_6428 [Caballeronia sp.]|jgi:hypothetical protein|uniref:DUF4148 domain-containing protein n=1 Tax=Caballeronia sp. TaxID=1931223 RepID=UPI0026323E97|nr:DUF4148 domain-containing protein [Caballeronia sp.]MDB5836598.1 hypothetical protein [Caballeronia sp.]